MLSSKTKLPESAQDDDVREPNHILQMISPTLTSKKHYLWNFISSFSFLRLWSDAILIKIIIINRVASSSVPPSRSLAHTSSTSNQMKLMKKDAESTASAAAKEVDTLTRSFTINTDTFLQMSTALMSHVKNEFNYLFDTEGKSVHWLHQNDNQMSIEWE